MYIVICMWLLQFDKGKTQLVAVTVPMMIMMMIDGLSERMLFRMIPKGICLSVCFKYHIENYVGLQIEWLLHTLLISGCFPSKFQV